MIKTAQLKDVPRIVDFLNKREIKKELHTFTYMNNIIRDVSKEGRIITYLEENEGIIAVLIMWCNSRILDEDEANIRILAVDPNHMRKGYGALLVKNAFHFAEIQGKKHVVLDRIKSSDNYQFWKKCGFEPEKTWDTKRGTRMERMRVEIGAYS